MVKDKLLEKVSTCCNKVHKELGPGFVERIYHCAIKIALEDEGLDFESEKDFSIFYNDQRVGSFRCDFYVENDLIVMVKAEPSANWQLYKQQMTAYLKAAKVKAGLLLNFAEEKLLVEQL